MKLRKNAGIASTTSDQLLIDAAKWVEVIQGAEPQDSDFSEWQEWLAADPSHAAAYDAAEEIWSLAGEIRPPPWPSREDLAHAIAIDRNAFNCVVRLGGDRLRFAVAASVVLAAIVVALVVQTGRVTALETTTAEQRSIQLSDGSRVTLAAETRLTVDMQKEKRVLRIERGEAYFEVAHDRLRPFIVRFNDDEAIAVGTAFDVEVESSSKRMTVTVGEGIVKLQARTPGDIYRRSNPVIKSIELFPGQRAAADLHGALRLPPIEIPEATAAWRQGRLEYLHEPLQEVIRDVNRYTSHKMKISDPSIGALQFTGTVLLDHVDEWLSALPGVFPVDIVEHGNQRDLKRALAK